MKGFSFGFGFTSARKKRKDFVGFEVCLGLEQW
jgi:hypothetical protein